MKKEDILIFKDKKLFLKLKNNYSYSCEILKFNEDSILIKDKYHLEILIDLDSIESISEFKNEVKDA